MRKNIVLILAAVLLAVIMFDAEKGNCADYERGKNVYNDKCAICHGSDGKGNGPAAASLTPSPADFTSASFWEKTNDARITDTIENGHGPMPAFTIPSGDIKAVIDYMKGTFKP